VSTRHAHDYELGRSPVESPCGDKTGMWQFVSDDAPDDNCGRRVVIPMSALGDGCTGSRVGAFSPRYFAVKMFKKTNDDRRYGPCNESDTRECQP
jgi:hypothetical protein